jgi:hypothetical protein
VLLPWGDEPGQAVIKKSIMALKNKKAGNLLLLYLFFILSMEVIRKESLTKLTSSLLL